MGAPNKGREPPSAYIRALVSGFGPDRRRDRQLLMLQAHVDASTEEGEIFVLAGYIAPAEVWALFSEDWQTELDRPQKLRVFKMKDQARNHPRRAERFYRVIEKHVTMAVSVTIPIPDLERIVSEAHWPPQLTEASLEQLKNPYFYGFQLLLSNFGAHQEDAGIREKVDFIFDDQTEREVIYRNWFALKASITGKAAEMMGRDPRFEPDDEVLPLQGADLWAWWVRHWRVNGGQPGPGTELDFWWKAERDIPRMAYDVSAEDIQLNIQNPLDRAWKLADWHSRIYGPISWCRKVLAFN